MRGLVFPENWTGTNVFNGKNQGKTGQFSWDPWHEKHICSMIFMAKKTIDPWFLWDFCFPWCSFEKIWFPVTIFPTPIKWVRFSMAGLRKSEIFNSMSFKAISQMLHVWKSAYIHPQNDLNVCKYSIHGAYGYGHPALSQALFHGMLHFFRPSTNNPIINQHLTKQPNEGPASPACG